MADRLWHGPRKPAFLLPLWVGLIQFAGTWFSSDEQPERRALDAVAVVLLLAGPVALVARRRHPVPVLAATLAATLLYLLLGYPYGPVFVSLVVAFFSAVTRGHRLAAWVTAGVGFAAHVAVVLVAGTEDDSPLSHAVVVAAWLLVVLVVGEVARVGRERAAEAERAHREEARRRAGEERLRIAQELHDVLAHNISLINVQAGVALHLLDEQPEQARTALSAIKDASKDVLGELRSVLGILRQGDEEPPRSPSPSLEHLDDLVSRAASAGLEVRVDVEGDPKPLPASVDRAAYRIVQEALTNVTRHAGPATAALRVAYGDEELTVQVDDNGRGIPSAETSGGGSGIPGMRERAAALGGELQAGPRPGGGFRVRARLPLDGSA